MASTVLGNQSITFPSGTTAQRPSGVNGTVRYNTDLDRMEAYVNGDWINVDNTIDGWATVDYIDTAYRFQGLQNIVGGLGNDRATLPFNTVQDPHDILASAGSNTFTVQKSGLHLFQGMLAEHADGHTWSPYVYNNTNNRWARVPNSTYTGEGSYGTSGAGYCSGSASDPLYTNAPSFYWLLTGVTYSFRWSNEANSGGLSTDVTNVFGAKTYGGVTMYNSLMRCTLYRLRGY